MDTETLQDAATAAQAERRATHPWVERIHQWLVAQDRSAETKVDFYMGREVYVGAMGGLDVRYGRREQMDVAQGLRELGWSRGYKRGEDGRMICGFWRPGAATRRQFTPGDRKGQAPKPAEMSVFGDLA